MIQELDIQEFGRARGLYPASWLTVEARSALNGVHPAWVFVDSARNPRSGLVWVLGMSGFYLGGDPDHARFLDDLTGLITQDLSGRLQALGYTDIEFSGCDPRWDQAIRFAFREQRLQWDLQLVYRSSETPAPASAPEPTGPREADPSTPGHLVTDPVGPGARAIGENAKRSPDRHTTVTGAPAAHPIARHLDKHGGGTLNPSQEVLRYWRDLETFESHRIGFCSTEGQEAVSACFSASVDGRVHAVQIETARPFRRRGHGLRAATAFRDACRSEGKIVHWDCMAENEASWRLAEKLGLVRIGTYRCYHFPMESR